MPLLDNAPAGFDIQTVQNADLSFTLGMKDGVGADIDFTNYTIDMQVRDATGIIVAELSTANGRVTIATILLTFRLPAANNPPPQSYIYDIVLTAPNGVKLDPLSGMLIVKSPVTL